MKSLDVLGFEPLVALNDFKVDNFAFLQGLETIAQNRRVVDKHVLPRILSDEPKAFLVVEPFHFPTCHRLLLRCLSLAPKTSADKGLKAVQYLKQFSRLGPGYV